MPTSTNPQETLVLSYLELRKSVGVIGVALPFVVAIGTMLFETSGLLGSISSYYYSIMGDVFVGSLCAIGVFMWSYRGYDYKDVIAAQIAAYSAIGIALFPTVPDSIATPNQQVVGVLHLVFAAIFFATLIYFALVLFRKTKADVPPTPEKLMRNKIYTACGFIMLACLLLLVALTFAPFGSALDPLNPVFWLESIMIEAFGISWLVKGEAILKD